VPWNVKTNKIKFSLDEGQTIQEFQFVGKTGDLVGSFADSQKGWGGFGDVEIDCEESSHYVGQGDYEKRYTCIKGGKVGAGWSPGIVSKDGNGGITMHGNDACVYTGTLSSGTITWKSDGGCAKSSYKKGWTWTKDASATDSAATVQVQGVASEPGGRSLVLMAYYYNFAAKSWVGVKMDFDALFFKDCDIDQDFEEWTIKSHAGEDCVLGLKQTVTRRKQCAFCKNGLDHERRITTAADECSCTRADYQCHFGYYLTKFGSCEHSYDCPLANCQPDIDFYDELCATSRDQNLPHIVKVPLDLCKDGALNDWNKWAEPQPLQCGNQGPTNPSSSGTTAAPSSGSSNGGNAGKSTTPGDPKKSKKGTVIIVVVVLLVIVIGVVGAILTKRKSVSLSISADRYSAVHNEDMPDDDDDDAVLGGL
jgi:hypothetical protein